MVRLTLVLFTLALASAQPVFELSGTVIDATTDQPLQEVEVSIIPGNGLVGPGVEVTTLKTDAKGMFRFTTPKGGQYVVRTRKAGYTRVSADLARGASDQGGATLSEAKPKAEFHFSLQRPARISGTIVDYETDKPISAFRYELANYSATNGRASARGGLFYAATDGTFENETAAGEYLIATAPQVPQNEHFLTKFTDEDVRKVDSDYQRAFFPGGPEVDTALPVRVTSGSSVNVGSIRVRKQPLYRVLVNLDARSCPEGEQMSGTETMVVTQTTYQFSATPCGPFLITHLSPGEYQLQLNAGKSPDNVSVTLRYTVTSSNQELSARLGKGTTLAGSIVAAEGAGDLPVTTFKVSFGPVVGGVPLAEVQPHDVDAKGRFEFPSVLAGRRRLTVAGMDDNYFIREVRINKQAAAGNIFNYDGAGELEVEIGRSPAVVTGTVVNGDKSVAGADVVFVRWPTLPLDDRDAVRHITTGDDGTFRIPRIVPGEYRLFAVSGSARLISERPSEWQRLTDRAEKLSLTPGAAPSVALKVQDPTR